MSSDCRLIVFLFVVFYTFKLFHLGASSSPSARYSWPHSASQWLDQYQSLLPTRSQVTPYSRSIYIKRPSSGHQRELQHQSAGYETDFEDQQATQQYNSYRGYDLNERFDDEDDYKKHHKIEHHEEAKEISFVYPVLLALLILGALFVPFISLFFFLAVSAFNCNGIGGGGGFNQVTPVFGRRRRRRSIVESASPSSSNFTTASRWFEEATSKNNKTTLEREKDSIGLSEGLLSGLMLLDEADQVNEEPPSMSKLSDYEFWRKQLARNTVKIRDALLEFGTWMDEAESEPN